jgi:hypothetical protein
MPDPQEWDYGFGHLADPKLRASLHERAIGYVLAVACDHPITTHAGKHPARALARGPSPALRASPPR